jgi:hypothetical protein
MPVSHLLLFHPYSMPFSDTNSPQVGPTEPSESGQWSVRESFVAILISNAPMVFPLLKRWTYTTIGLASMDHNCCTAGSYPLGEIDKSKTGNSGSIARSGEGKRKDSMFRHPLSIPNDTAWGSDEAIVKTEESAMRSEDGSLQARTPPEGDRGVFPRDTGSKSGGSTHGNGIARGVGCGDIVMTREWKVSEEQS